MAVANTRKKPEKKAKGTKGDAPPLIRLPADKDDRPHWAIVGGIGVVALGLGFWAPRACGLKFAAPEEEGATAAASGEPVPSNEPPPVVTAASTGAPVATIIPADPNALAIVTVAKSTLMRCGDLPGKDLKPSRCGDPLLDGVVMPKLESLGQCPAAANVVGRLSVSVEIDFLKKAVKVTAGKSSVKKAGVPNDKAIEPLLSCLRPSVQSIFESDTTKRDHARYTIAYALTLAPTAASAGSGAPSPSGSVAAEKSASGTAKVEVDMALVRDQPNPNAALLGRLARGTTVSLTGVAGHWYHIKFGDGDSKEGWIFRTNIGK